MKYFRWLAAIGYVVCIFFAPTISAHSQSGTAAQSPADPKEAFVFASKLYSEGKYAQALQVFMRIAPQNPRARTIVGTFHDRGLSVPKNPTLAVSWYEKAAQSGDVEGQYRLAAHLAAGTGVAREPVRARRIYQLCAEAGDERCQNNLGLAMLHGLGGPVDKASAVRFFAEAAAKGQINAITSLADCYENGNGVSTDLSKAVSLYTQAAKRGFHIAHQSLGSLYERGLGLPRNDTYAAMHYLLATRKIEGNDNSYYRQEYDKAKGALDRLVASLSSEQWEKARLLAERWPNAASANTDVAMGSSGLGPAGKLANSAIASKLSAATALVIGQTKQGIVTGSTFWIAPSMMVTNRHVVEDIIGDEVLVLRAGSSRYLQGSVIAQTPTSDVGHADLAVIRVASFDGTVVLPLATSVEALSDVVASGYPGFAIQGDNAFWRRVKSNDWTAPSVVLTSGQVSSIQKPHGQAEILMHTAQVFGGSSGGPLIDRCGRVVGVNTFRYADTKTQEQANYAVSSYGLMIFLRDNAIPFQGVPGQC